MADECQQRLRERRSIRLHEYDYSQAGAYFVTVCTLNRGLLLGGIVEGKMVLSEYGRVVAECWEWLPRQYPPVRLDEWVIMPNHLHGILVLSWAGGSRTAPNETPSARTASSGTAPAGKPLGRLVGAFKTVSTKRINELRDTAAAPFWQRNYYEHIIRDEDEMNHIRQYIADNPIRWTEDEDNPERRAAGDPCRGGS